MMKYDLEASLIVKHVNHGILSHNNRLNIR